METLSDLIAKLKRERKLFIEGDLYVSTHKAFALNAYIELLEAQLIELNRVKPPVVERPTLFFDLMSNGKMR